MRNVIPNARQNTNTLMKCCIYGTRTLHLENNVYLWMWNQWQASDVLDITFDRAECRSKIGPALGELVVLIVDHRLTVEDLQ